MPKIKIHVLQPKKKPPNVIRLNVRDIEKKIRKPHAPATKIHASKKQYQRKSNRPKMEDDV
ncbi:MAG: hypothetical protein NUV81_04005 [bacterium]|nr:hypothetical protein [bacterium]